MSKIISIGNNKGGIAKTTTAIHLAAYLAAKKHKVLVVDFDPQRNLSTGYKIQKDYPYTILDLLKGNSGFRVTRKADNLFVLAGSKALDSETYSINILRDRFKQLQQIAEANNQKYYDYIILDCPPQPLIKKYFTDKKGNKYHIPKLTELAVAASDYAMIPLNTEEFSINGLKDYIGDLSSMIKEFNPNMKIAGVFFSMVLVTKKNFERYYQEVKASIPDKYFFNTYIRQDTMIDAAKEAGKSIFEHSPRSRAAIDYNNLCTELLNKIV